MKLDYAAIRKLVSIVEVLDLIQYRPRRKRANQWRGHCPLCHANNQREATFSVNVQRNIFHCFRCQASGNQLDLWVQLTRLPISQATLDLCKRLNFEPVEFKSRN